ncbi:hypothetical protein C8R47DRAFT_1130123 [Mycena vitilis]|nr:hypothetical protein C8R47DRAFT_1130123 [Mycena vitilis]
MRIRDEILPIPWIFHAPILSALITFLFPLPFCLTASYIPRPSYITASPLARTPPSPAHIPHSLTTYDRVSRLTTYDP